MTKIDAQTMEVLQKEGLMPEPKLPAFSALVGKAQTRGCAVSVFHPSAPGSDAWVSVSRKGQVFTAEDADAAVALAFALAECLPATTIKQTSLFDDVGKLVEAAENKLDMDEVSAEIAREVEAMQRLQEFHRQQRTAYKSTGDTTLSDGTVLHGDGSLTTPDGVHHDAPAGPVAGEVTEPADEPDAAADSADAGEDPEKVDDAESEPDEDDATEAPPDAE